MASQKHIDILRQGVEVWNEWREKEDLRDGGPYIKGSKFNKYNFCNADFSEGDLSETDFRQAFLCNAELWGANLCDADFGGADLTGSDLGGANLTNTNFSNAKLHKTDFTSYSHEIHTGPNIKEFTHKTDLINTNFQGADLSNADLSRQDLTQANFRNTILKGTNLSNADLSNIDLSYVDLSNANLTGANLTDANFTGSLLNGADLSGVYLCRTNFRQANLKGCRIYGISVWDVELEETIQKDLIITPEGSLTLTVDNIEIAQFIYLILNNSKIREIINAITSKVVLILGRFTDERKPVVDALRDELRKHNFSPVVFDFDPSAKRDLTETVSLLANMSRFVIADITNAKSIPQELHAIVPHLPSVIVQPILHVDAREYAMFEHYERYPWVLPIYHYQDIPSLLASIEEHIIKPVEKMEGEKDKTKALEDKVRILEEENRKLRGGK